MITLTDEQWARVLALIPKLEQKKVAMGIAGNYLTDEQALEAKQIYPQFKAGIAVTVGQRYVDSNGDLYKVVRRIPLNPIGNPLLFLRFSQRFRLMSGLCLYSRLGRRMCTE